MIYLKFVQTGSGNCGLDKAGAVSNAICEFNIAQLGAKCGQAATA